VRSLRRELSVGMGAAVGCGLRWRPRSCRARWRTRSRTFAGSDLSSRGRLGRWRGQPVAPPAPGSGRCLTGRERRPDARSLDLRPAPRHAPAFSDALVLAPYRRLRATASRRTLICAWREIHESRARIAARADNERRRNERDIHEGAQQRLLSVRLRLVLAGRGAQDLAAAMVAPRELASEVDAAHRRRPVTRARHLPLRADRLRAGRGARRSGGRCTRVHDGGGRTAAALRRGRSRMPWTSAAWRLCRNASKHQAMPGGPHHHG
jgi:hypothetical protein